MTKLRTAYETCFACKGSGVGPKMNGDPDGVCWECKGYGTLRIRDEKGRFACREVKPRKQHDQATHCIRNLL